MDNLIKVIIRSLENDEWDFKVVTGVMSTLVLTHKTKPCSFEIYMFPSIDRIQGSHEGLSYYLGGDLSWCTEPLEMTEIALAAERGRHFKREKELLTLKTKMKCLFLDSNHD